VSKDWLELTPDQRLVAVTAIQKVINEAVKTNTPGNVRAEADEYMKAKLPDGGSYQIRVDGKKIGTYSVIAKEVGEGIDVYMSDDAAFNDWVRDEEAVGNAAIEWVLADRKRREAFARHIAEVTGVIPDGVEVYQQRPHLELSTKLSQVKPEQVAEVLGGALPTAVVGLLEGAK
jgi:hypothetical protein